MNTKVISTVTQKKLAFLCISELRDFCHPNFPISDNLSIVLPNKIPPYPSPSVCDSRAPNVIQCMFVYAHSCLYLYVLEKLSGNSRVYLYTCRVWSEVVIKDSTLIGRRSLGVDNENSVRRLRECGGYFVLRGGWGVALPRLWW